MRAIWKGTVSFGLITIPISLYPATRKEDLKFRMLRRSDLSPINFKRVAEADGEEVPWDEIVKGYEYEKGKFVIIKDEDFRRVDVEATETIDIMDFVKLAEINPIYFDKPYYLEPKKGSEKAYSLLLEILRETALAGVSKVVIKTRQYLSAVRPYENVLILELMHFSNELVDPNDLHIPKRDISKKELEVGEMLVTNMTEEWIPEKYTDEYRSRLMKLIDEKVQQEETGVVLKKGGERHVARKKATDITDLVSALQESLKVEKRERRRSQNVVPSEPRKRSRTSKRVPENVDNYPVHRHAAKGRDENQ